MAFPNDVVNQCSIYFTFETRIFNQLGSSTQKLSTFHMFSFQTIFVILLEIGNLLLKWEQKKSKFQTKDVDDGVSVC